MKKRNPKEVMLVVGTIIAAILIGSGCTMTNPQFPNPFKKNIPQGAESPYKYYVIDINSDTPDAFFETFEEASVYQKEFAENHEYVIVKLDKGYKVYNMVENQNDTQTVQTGE